MTCNRLSTYRIAIAVTGIVSAPRTTEVFLLFNLGLLSARYLLLTYILDISVRRPSASFGSLWEKQSRSRLQGCRNIECLSSTEGTATFFSTVAFDVNERAMEIMENRVRHADKTETNDQLPHNLPEYNYCYCFSSR